MQREFYRFQGKITALSNLAVSRSGEKFWGDGKQDINRIPRHGAKLEDSPGYYPASTLMGPLRRATSEMLRLKEKHIRSEEFPFTTETSFLLRQGMISIGLEESQLEKDDGTFVPGEFTKLREINPFLSLHGRWRFSGNWGIDNAYPTDRDAILYIGPKCRANDYIRVDDLSQTFTAQEQEKLAEIFLKNSEVLAGNKSLKDEKAEIKKRIGKETDKKIKSQLSGRLDELDELIKQNKRNAPSHTYAESVQFLTDGYEVIKRGTEMDHVMRVKNASHLEIGIILATLRHFSREPIVGGRRKDGCGEISAEYDVTVWPETSDEPMLLGTVYFGPMDFGFKPGSEQLEKMLADFDETVKDLAGNGIDYSRAGLRGYEGPAEASQVPA